MDDVRDTDDGHQRANHQFNRAEAPRLQHQQKISQHTGDDHGLQQRHPGQERDAQSGPYELGKVGRHGGKLTDEPHDKTGRRRQVSAAELRQILARHDAHACRQHLEQHRHQARCQHDP